MIALLAAAPLFSAAIGAAAAERRPLRVLGAASLQNVLEEVAAAFARDGGARADLSFAGSSALARQIEEGAPADVFISADEQWMDVLQAKGLIDARSRTDLLTNRLALVAPAASPIRLTIAKDFPLAAALSGGRLAMAGPTVPAGIYGEAALKALGVWSAVSGKVARAENVRAALNFVAHGDAPLGIVYDTDARVEPRVRIVALFPEASHPKILYPAALLKNAAPDAARFLAFLKGAEARAIFTRAGFGIP